jgi:uncharacterized membrane protein
LDFTGHYNGFLHNGTTWTTLNYPGASETTAYGISGSNIVGYYEYEDGSRHGFLYDGTTWRTLDYPGAFNTYAYGISGNRIVGCFSDSSGQHGFLLTIPEPATLSLLAIGGLVLVRRKRG